jgi:hypothetical protein
MSDQLSWIKLLNKKEDFQKIPQKELVTIFNHVATQTNEINPKWSKVKKYILEHPNDPAVQRFVGVASPLQEKAQERRKRSLERLRKGKELKKITSSPKKRVRGCLATRLKPSDYSACNSKEVLENPEYEKIGPLVSKKYLQYLPEVLKDENEIEIVNSILENKKKNKEKLSEFPRGYATFIKNHPDQFADFLSKKEKDKQLLKKINEKLSEEERETIDKVLRKSPQTLRRFLEKSKGEEVKRKRTREEEEALSFEINPEEEEEEE